MVTNLSLQLERGFFARKIELEIHQAVSGELTCNCDANAGFADVLRASVKDAS
jgi:hypothetical protein